MAKFNRSVSLLSWAYNEESIISEFLVRAEKLISEAVEDYEIIVVDDGSTDNTSAILKSFAQKNPRLRIITNPTNLNVGISCRKAIEAASKEFLFWQTVDWSYDISRLREFLELLHSHDVVVGVRRKPVMSVDLNAPKFLILLHQLFGIKHITKRSDTVPKAFVSIVNYMLIRILFRFPLSDYQNIVFYKTNLIQSIHVESKSSFINPEYLYKSYWKGARIAEVPISFIPRISGVAKGTRIGSIKASIIDIFKLWFRWVVLKKMDHHSPGSIVRLQPQNWEKNETSQCINS
jgi:glycosyltransferase involved in cell wall biosynthesis